MKQTRLFLLTVFITLAGFGSLIYTSCKKDKCKGVVCQNSGVCSNGVCTCKTGYSGVNCEKSTIKYQNNSYTELNITLDGIAYTIPAGNTSAFIGLAGSSVQVTNVYTRGEYGKPINWADFTDHFPTNGDQLTEPFDVPAGNFFLRIKNVSTTYINVLFVNRLEPDETYEFPYITNDGLTHDIGYYNRHSGTIVRAEGAPAYWEWTSVPNTTNALFSVEAN